MKNMDISILNLLLAFFLLIFPIYISYIFRLNLKKDIVISCLRALVQLFIVGITIQYIIKANSIFLTIFTCLVLIVNASWATKNTIPNIKKEFYISLLSVFSGTTGCLSFLTIMKVIDSSPASMIVFTGMIASTVMIGNGICWRTLENEFVSNRELIDEYLSLGGTPFQASFHHIQVCLKAGISPYIDQAKTSGIVTLPGMMAGLILSGQSPVVAIKFQIIVIISQLVSVSIGAAIIGYFGSRMFFVDGNLR